MHESLLCPPSSDHSYAGYLKFDEGRNKWVEYWVVIRDNNVLLYSDECSEESGEEAIKIIELSAETRCEFMQRRNYHFRFKLTTGSSTSYRVKCSSGFHRQQWISHILSASAKDGDRVIELNPAMNSERDGGGVHRRTVSAESQLSSDGETLQGAELGLDVSSGPLSDKATSSTVVTPTRAALESPTKSTERRGSKGLLRRLSFKASSRLRRDSTSSPKEDYGFTDIGSLSSPSSPSGEKTQSPSGSSGSPNGNIVRNKVFVNPAFVPSPETTPKLTRQNPIQESM